MQPNHRRLLYSAERVRSLLIKAHTVARTDQHKREIEALQAQIDELREVLRMLIASLREQGERDLAELQAALAKLTWRDPSRPLH
jgi:hypothetical protein